MLDQATAELVPLEVRVAAPLRVQVDVESGAVDMLHPYEARVLRIATRDAALDDGRTIGVVTHDVPLATGVGSCSLERPSLAPVKARLSVHVPGVMPVALREVDVLFDYTALRFGDVYFHVGASDFVTGTVVASNGAGLAKSIVTLKSEGRSVDFWARRSGRFLFCMPDGPATLVAKYGAVLSEPMTVLPRAALAPVTLRIDTNKLIAVRLTYPDGTPVAEYQAGRAAPDRAQSDALDLLQPAVDGVLYLKNDSLPTGTRLYFSGIGFSFFRDIDTVWSAGNTYAVTVADEPKAIVLIKGIPAAGAVTVRLEEVEVPDQRRRVPRQFWTREVRDGCAQFSDVAYGVYEATVKHADATPLRRTLQVYAPSVVADFGGAR